MDIGMLWYDDDRQRTLDQKVARAVEYYASKYGSRPNLCHVNPGMLPAGATIAAGVRVMPARMVMANHFWLGVAEAAGTADRPRGGKEERR